MVCSVAPPIRTAAGYVAGPSEQSLIGHMQIVMHEWPREARENTRDHILAALDEAFRQGVAAVKGNTAC